MWPPLVVIIHDVMNDDFELPVWIDDTLDRALKMNPVKRYPVVSEFIHDL